MMGDRYWQLSLTDKRCLGAAKRCYVIAAENALQITKLYPDETNSTRQEMSGKINQNL